ADEDAAELRGLHARVGPAGAAAGGERIADLAEAGVTRRVGARGRLAGGARVRERGGVVEADVRQLLGAIGGAAPRGAGVVEHGAAAVRLAAAEGAGVAVVARRAVIARVDARRGGEGGESGEGAAHPAGISSGRGGSSSLRCGRARSIALGHPAG